MIQEHFVIVHAITVLCNTWHNNVKTTATQQCYLSTDIRGTMEFLKNVANVFSDVFSGCDVCTVALTKWVTGGGLVKCH